MGCKASRKHEGNELNEEYAGLLICPFLPFSQSASSLIAPHMKYREKLFPFGDQQCPVRLVAGCNAWRN